MRHKHNTGIIDLLLIIIGLILAAILIGVFTSGSHVRLF
jgi:hypothetical protein